MCAQLLGIDIDDYGSLLATCHNGMIDPQERLFLETAWQTIEDAGYTKESISGRRVGVFVGVMWGQYELFVNDGQIVHSDTFAFTPADGSVSFAGNGSIAVVSADFRPLKTWRMERLLAEETLM